jgi:formylglycine-generating enzyme required for sulfatase activity
MSDIFLSYARADRLRVLPLIQALERRGWSVWWDLRIPYGKSYAQVIEEELEAASCVIVVWSQTSVHSHWVNTEAAEGARRGVLVPIMIDAVRIPLEFRRLQTAYLVDWQGAESHEEFDRVLRAVTNLIGPPPPPETETPRAEVPASQSPELPLPEEATSPVPEPPNKQRVVTPQIPEQQEQPADQRTRDRREKVKTPQSPGKKRLVISLVTGVMLAVILALYFIVQKPDAGKPTIVQTEKPSKPAMAPTVRNSIGMEFVPIPAGAFMMGSAQGNNDERPSHQVTISRPFYLGKYEVTQAQWEAVMGSNPSRFTGQPDRPVEQVSWDDVQAFIRKLNEKEGGTMYRLPTEAEWEYAARAGSTTAYSFGDDPGQLGEYAWYTDNSGGQTHPVGQRQPNAWGLYDMHGNVWEWVQDWYGTYAAEPVTDPQGPSSGSNRVVRGGSWRNGARFCRSAYRFYAHPGDRIVDLGFRLLRTAP